MVYNGVGEPLSCIACHQDITQLTHADLSKSNHQTIALKHYPSISKHYGRDRQRTPRNPIFMFHKMLKNFKRPGKLKKSSQRKTTLQQEAHP
jgi:hypothetical protein